MTGRSSVSVRETSGLAGSVGGAGAVMLTRWPRLAGCCARKRARSTVNEFINIRLALDDASRERVRTLARCVVHEFNSRRRREAEHGVRNRGVFLFVFENEFV